MRTAITGLMLAAVLCGESLTPAGKAIDSARATLLKDPSNADRHTALAMALARRAREVSDHAFYDEAEKSVRKALELKPDDFEALKVRCWTLLGQHEFARALDLARQLNKRMPDDATVYGMLTDAHVQLGNYKEAEDAAQWMLNLGRSSIPGLTRAAHLRELFGDIDGALELMNTAYARLNPAEVEDRAWTAVQIGHLLSLSGKTEQASAVFKHALELMPDYHYALAALARVRLAEGAAVEAVKLLRRRYQAAAHPENLFELAAAMDRAGLEKEAREAFVVFEMEALAESKAWDNANRELTLYYADYAANPKKALDIASLEYQRRRDIHTLDAYAWALHKSGRSVEARRQIDAALAVGTAEPRILYHAGAIAAAQRDVAAARKFLKRVPDATEESEAAQSLLRSIGAPNAPAVSSQ